MSLQKHDFARSDMKRRAGLLHGVVLEHDGRLRMVNCGGPGQRGWGRYMLTSQYVIELSLPCALSSTLPENCENVTRPTSMLVP